MVSTADKIEIFICEKYSVKFWVNSNTKLNHILASYCKMRKISNTDRIFTFGDKVINENMTPEELGMKSGDIIRVLLVDVEGFDERDGTIVIHVEGHTNNVKCILKRDENFGNFIKSYCAYEGVDDFKFRFIYKGLSINELICPNDLEMEDGDIIEVYEEIGVQ